MRAALALVVVFGTCRGGRTLADAHRDARALIQAAPDSPVVCEEYPDGFACLSHDGDAYCPRSPETPCYGVDAWGPQAP